MCILYWLGQNMSRDFFVQSTQPNSGGPHTTLAYQVFFTPIIQNFPKFSHRISHNLNRPRKDYQLDFLVQLPQKVLDNCSQLYYNRRAKTCRSIFLHKRGKKYLTKSLRYCTIWRAGAKRPIKSRKILHIAAKKT